ncbi:MAG: hypothetical protein IJU41_05665, partial [Clostridia bacterium]|nr:hypothetical protein [Clostridia bacterium]
MKRILYFVSLLSLIVIGVSLFAVASFAADKPVLYSESKIYVDNNNGKDANNGLSPATAKKLLSAAVGLLPDGGTVVASGKIAAGTYTVPALGGTLLLTSNDGAVNYKNFNPANNPACAFKMSSGASVTFTSNVIIEDIILFQEASVSNVIYVKNGATLWIGENVSCIGSPNSQEPCYMSIVVEEGASVVVKSGIFQSITGAGTIVIDGATVIEAPVTQADIAAANALYSLEVIADCGDLGAEVTRAEAAQWIESMTGYTGATFSTALVGESAFLGQFLRALGYTDAADPVAQAYALGLTDHGTASDAFVRKDAYNILAKSLSADTYAGDPVEDLLVENGVASARAIGFAKRIAAGEKITVVCVGDSITEGVGASAASKFSYPAQLQALLGNGFTVVNCGKSGAYVMNLESTYNVKAADRPDLWYPATAQYSTLMATDADVVIVMLGTNDARSMTAPPAEDVFAQDYKQLIADIAALPSHPEIYLSTTIPAVNADLTHQGTYYTLPARIRSIADELKLPLVDTSATLSAYYYAMLPYNDSVHPTDASYPALATNFYNEVFGHAKALPVLENAADDVVYLASTGSSTAGGTSPSDAVDRLAVAVAKLGKNGGTVVVCDAVDVGRSHLAPCGGEVVITSVFDDVDYRATNGAKLNIKG